MTRRTRSQVEREWDALEMSVTRMLSGCSRTRAPLIARAVVRCAQGSRCRVPSVTDRSAREDGQRREAAWYALTDRMREVLRGQMASLCPREECDAYADAVIETMRVSGFSLWLPAVAADAEVDPAVGELPSAARRAVYVARARQALHAGGDHRRFHEVSP